MTTTLEVPAAGESVSEVEIAEWRKSEGDRVERDEVVVVLMTDKASMELPAPASGVLADVRARAGDSVSVGDVLAEIRDDDGAARAPERDPRSETDGETVREPRDSDDGERSAERARDGEPGGDRPAPPGVERRGQSSRARTDPDLGGPRAAPPRDAERDAEKDAEKSPETSAEAGAERDGSSGAETAAPTRDEDDEERATRGGEDDVELVPMSLLRQGIARRLVEAQRDAALLTTFAEADLSAVLELRRRLGEDFSARHDASLGITAFFVAAVAAALREHRELNAEVRGTDVAYHRRVHVGVAVGSERGLVVPVLEDADRLTLAEIERRIAGLAERAESGSLELEELRGGTFTVTNGGVFGSLLSTPIVNPPQSGVLGLHAIEDRPVVREGAVVVRPMTYLALTYDHRVVDGRGAVLFLQRVVQLVEDPERMLLGV